MFGSPQFVELGPNDPSCLIASFRYLARSLAFAGFLLALVKLVAEAYQRGTHTIYLFPAAVMIAVSVAIMGIANVRLSIRTKMMISFGVTAIAIAFLFWQRVGPQSKVFGGRVALVLVALGLSLGLMASDEWRLVRLGQIIAAAFPFGYSLFLTFDLALDGKIQFSGLPPSLACAFFLNSIAAILAVPDQAPVSVFTRDSSLAEMSRRLVPAVMLIILATAWVRYRGEHSGMYTAEVGVSLFAVASILLFIAVIHRTGTSLSSALELSQEAARVADQEREALQKRVHELEQQVGRGHSAR